MKIGDLVVFDADDTGYPGALAAVKYFIRMRGRIGSAAGLIVGVHGTHCSVIFPDEEVIVLNKKYLRCVNDPG
tara:strand:- start:499 stop:717 length:219 start_codon:yes stop_codon:yes gene_type:complete